jgi:hypothetical protein
MFYIAVILPMSLLCHLVEQVVRVNKDSSIAEVAAAVSVLVQPSSSSAVLLFPEVSGLMRPSSYALDPPAGSSSPLTASGIIAALPPPFCLFWQPQSLDTHVRAK